MRVLIIPELYRPRDASANGTLNDAVTWVREWLRQDPTIHVYWLLPDRATANYEREYVLGDRDRVTLIEADPLMSGTGVEGLFTETGYTEDELHALERHIYDEYGYVDVVIDQRRNGRAPLVKWLLYLAGRRPDEPKPFDVVVNVHDLLLPFKYPDDGFRDEYNRKLEVVEATLADGCWFKARFDAEEMPSFASDFLPDSTVADTLDDAVMTDSPIDFSQFEERYPDAPEWLHVAGSNWGKKHVDLVMDVAADLNDQYDIGTVITSMEEIPDRYCRHPWVSAHPEASRETYERMLRKGDLTICASEYDTLARTWFEQAASGQVLVLRDEPWIHDCVPDDSPLVAPVDRIRERTKWVVEHWPDAVAANRRLVEHVRAVRNPARAGRKTLDDLTWRVEKKIDEYADIHRRKGGRRTAIGEAIRGSDSDALSLDELNERGREVTPDGRPLLDHDWCSLTDLVFALRERGYRDTGSDGIPVFHRVTDATHSELQAGRPAATQSAPARHPSAGK